jgi:hypothetical protein
MDAVCAVGYVVSSVLVVRQAAAGHALHTAPLHPGTPAGAGVGAGAGAAVTAHMLTLLAPALVAEAVVVVYDGLLFVLLAWRVLSGAWCPRCASASSAAAAVWSAALLPAAAPQASARPRGASVTVGRSSAGAAALESDEESGEGRAGHDAAHGPEGGLDRGPDGLAVAPGAASPGPGPGPDDSEGFVADAEDPSWARDSAMSLEGGAEGGLAVGASASTSLLADVGGPSRRPAPAAPLLLVPVVSDAGPPRTQVGVSTPLCCWECVFS